MESITGENLSIIKTSNEQMLAYFESVHITKLEALQTLKSESFEIEVKIEELEKTKRLYSFKANDSKNIFSPLSLTTSSEHERSRILENQLHDLYGAKAALSARIATLEQELASVTEKLNLLKKAEQALKGLPVEKLSGEQQADHSDEDAVFHEETPDTINHGYNVLMLEEFHNSRLADILGQFIKEPLLNNYNKMEVLGWLLNSDVDRARVTLMEMQSNSEQMLSTLDDLIARLQHTIDDKQPVWMVLEDFINHYREEHKKCTIETDIDCPETQLNIPPIVLITFMQILSELFDNIFKHSNANKVTAKIIISNRLVDVFLNDNGVGIQENYLSGSKWYSGLHRVREAIYLLDGRISIQGDLISGTNVRFSFPIKQNS